MSHPLLAFYRNPKGDVAVQELRLLLSAGALTQRRNFFLFARIIQLYPAAVAAIECVAADDPDLALVLAEFRNAFASPDFPRPLTMDLDGPEVLDLLWSEFAVTGNPGAVQRVISVLDWPDVIRERLATWVRGLRTIFFDRWRQRKTIALLTRCDFPIDYDRRLLAPGVDLDLHVALLAKNGKLKFDELPFALSSAETMKLAMKSAALWSLRSLAATDDQVAELCQIASRSPGGASRLLLTMK